MPPSGVRGVTSVISCTWLCPYHGGTLRARRARLRTSHALDFRDFLMRILAFTVLTAIGSVALAPGANAQPVYKCGNTYSQTPCPDSQRVQPGSATPYAPSKFDDVRAARDGQRDVSGETVGEELARREAEAKRAKAEAQRRAEIAANTKTLSKGAAVGFLTRCENQIKALLRDPGSVQFGDQETIRKPDGSVTVYLDYNARNGFGGYAGMTTKSCEF